MLIFKKIFFKPQKSENIYIIKMTSKNKINNHFLLYIFQFFLLFKIISTKAVVLQFNELYNNSTKNSFLNENNNILLDEDKIYFTNLYENIIYTELNIGSKNQKTMCLFSSNNNMFYFNNNEKCYEKPEYNFSFTETTNIIEKKEGDDYFPGYYILSDNIQIYTLEKNKKQLEIINEFQFRFDEPRRSWGNDDSEEKIYCAEIGIQINQEKKTWSKFIKQLKDKEMIDSYTITLNYSDNSGGYFYIGEYPHEYEPNNYKETELMSTYALPKQSFAQFRILMENIYIEINKTKQIQIHLNEIYFHLESGVIECATEYYNIIKTIFFEKYLNNSICNEKSMIYDLNAYNMIICEDNKNFDIKSFPSIYFYHSELNYYFNLNYKDLFEKKNNKFYFLIIHSSFSGGYWKFGKPFLKKYQITLNLDAKRINFYNIYKEINNDDDIHRNYRKEKKKNIILIIICIILFGVLLVITLFLVKKIKGERKRRANELKDDEYEYNPNEDDIGEENNYKQFKKKENNVIN